MSSYVVESRTISKIISAVSLLEDETIRNICSIFNAPCSTYPEPEELKGLGKKLLAFNVFAYCERYQNETLLSNSHLVTTEGLEINTQGDKKEILAQGVGALKCLSYQCAEGRAYTHKNYHYLEEVKSHLLTQIVKIACPGLTLDNWG